MDFGNYVAILVIGLIWITLWTCWVKRVGYTLDSIETYEERIVETDAEKNGGMRQSIETATKTVLWFEIISWTAVLFKSIFYSDVFNWTLKGFVLESSEFTSELLFDWKVHLNGTMYWYDNYGQKLNATTIFLGCLGIFMEFTSILLLVTIRDTILMLTFTLGANIWRFINKIVDFANLPPDEVREEDCQEMEKHWETYLMAQYMVKDMNWAFGILVKALHVGNELFLVYFMNYCLDTRTPILSLLWMLLIILKFLYGYVYAALVHQYVILYENQIIAYQIQKMYLYENMTTA